MSDNATNKPTHRAYVVINREGSEKGTWREIGAVWGHKDGKGFDVVLDTLPTDGRIVCRPNEPKSEAA